MSLPHEVLFKYNKKNEEYEFIFYHKENFEEVSLGRPLVRNFEMVYDYQNQQIGFYSKNYVKYINSKFPPDPPRVYEELPDTGEPIDDNENNDPNKVPYTEENRRRRKERVETKKILDIIKKMAGVTSQTKTKEVEDAYMVQELFYAFIILVCLGFLAFGGYIIYKNRMKPQYMRNEYFVEKANELTEEI